MVTTTGIQPLIGIGDQSPSSTKHGKSRSPNNRKNAKPSNMNVSNLNLHPLSDEGTNEGQDSQNDADHKDGDARKSRQGVSSLDKKREKGSDEESSDVESMLREMDPAKRHIKALKIKQKHMERNRRKPPPKLSVEKRGWNAPLDEPYIPVGRMTELVQAIEQVRQNLPHTRERFKKQTYRQMLMVKKRERDLRDRQRQIKQGNQQSRNLAGTSMSQSSIDEIKMEDPSRVVQNILPKEQANLVSIRNYAYDEKVREMQTRRQSAPAGPRINKFGRIAAGYVVKKSEKREEVERKRKLKETRSPSQQKKQQSVSTMSVNQSQQQQPPPQMQQQDVLPEAKVIKSDIEIQMEKEKSRYWIRKRNGRIYDEKIKNLILTTDNGSALLKQEIQESEGRLAAVKLGRPLNEVVPKHPENYFLTDKEDYFHGEQKVLRKQERENAQREEAEEAEEESHVELGKEFQTIGSLNESAAPAGGGFFLTEQPLVADEADRTNVVRVPDLIGAKDVETGTREDEKVRVSQMFASATNNNYEQVYRATTSHVKGMFLQRVKSRDQPTLSYQDRQRSADRIKGDQAYSTGRAQAFAHNPSSYHQRANSMSTAAATAYGFYRSGGHQTQVRLSEPPNSNIETNRVMSAMTEPGTGQNGTRRGSQNQGHGHVKVNSLTAKHAQQNLVNMNDSVTMIDSNGSGIQIHRDLNQSESQLDNRGESRGTGVQSQIAFNAKRLLKDARTKRTMSMTNALQQDLDGKKNRVRYLQGLQKDRVAQRKLDQAKGQKLFEGFTKDEMLEILVELPQLKKMQKEKAKLGAQGPEPPQFNNTQLIHLDSLNDIENRGKANLRKGVLEQIEKRKKKISKEVNEADEQYGMIEGGFSDQQKSVSRTNAAILKKFQQNSKDGFDDYLEPAFNFHDSLKQRLNFADARQQAHLYEAFKHEEFASKLWEENGPDHKAMDSERNLNNQQRQSLQNLRERRSFITEQIGSNFNEQQAGLAAREGSSQNLAGPNLKRQQTATTQMILNTESQRQVDEELREYDHSDQLIIVKLIEVYEKRMAQKRQQKEEALLKKKTGLNISVQAPNSTGNNAEAPQGLRRAINRKSSTEVVIANDEDKSAADINEAPEPVPTKMVKNQTVAPNRRKQPRITEMPLKAQMTLGVPQNASSTRQQRLSKTSNTQLSISMNMRERKRNIQLKKDYKRFAIEYLTKEYWRVFDALVGSNDLDMELVIHSFASSTFYKEAREFLVVKGKFLTDGHLIHLKEDPKTVLSLYRMFMLHYKTNQMSTIDKKLLPRKRGGGGGHTQSGSGLSYIEGEESDYSESDFQDLMSNKQIEENIRVFFDRMHELVNPIDEQRLKLDSVQQIKSTVKTFYKRKADQCESLLQELDQMRAERPTMIEVKQQQFNDPECYNQPNLHVGNIPRASTADGAMPQTSDPYLAAIPNQQCRTRMTDVRLNAELFRLRKFKKVAQMTGQWYNDLATRVLHAQLQEEPLVQYILDQIKNVIEIGQVFTRDHYFKMMSTFDKIDSRKPEVLKMQQFLQELIPNFQADGSDGNQNADLLSGTSHLSFTGGARHLQKGFEDISVTQLDRSHNNEQFAHSLGKPPRPQTHGKQQKASISRVTFSKDD